MKRLFLSLILLFLVILSAAGLWFWQQYQGFLQTPLSLPDKEVVYEIKRGASVSSVATDLQQKGYLSDARYFKWYARSERLGGQIKTGEYVLEPGLTPVSLLQLFVSGKTKSYAITLVEGWSFNQVMEKINQEPYLDHKLSGLTADEIMTRLGYPGQHPEGRFFPDTYLFTKMSSDLELLQRAYSRMEVVLDKAWQQRSEDTVLKTPYEALILASIVEKETGKVEERPEISGVFTRRLQKNMKLQTDPTVIYGMGSRYKGNIRRKDLREDTPYNTYVHKGLTPTPICMPGEEAIEAALNPKPGKSLYFVSRGDGSHKFSDTLEQHNAAVRKYQLRGSK